MITELYSPDCLFTGVKLGHDKLLRFEHRVLAAAPGEIRMTRPTPSATSSPSKACSSIPTRVPS